MVQRAAPAPELRPNVQATLFGAVKTLSKAVPLVLAFATVLVVWQLVIAVFKPHVSLLPPPSLVAVNFQALVASGELFQHAGISLMRVFSAWIISGCIASPLGARHGMVEAIRKNR